MAFALLAPGSAEPTGPEWLKVFVEYGGDKLVHAGLFFVQAMVTSWATRGRRPSTLWLAGGLAALYGAVLEWGQLSVPGRSWEMADVVANAFGAFLWPALWSFRSRS